MPLALLLFVSSLVGTPVEQVIHVVDKVEDTTQPEENVEITQHARRAGGLGVELFDQPGSLRGKLRVVFKSCTLEDAFESPIAD